MKQEVRFDGGDVFLMTGEMETRQELTDEVGVQGRIPAANQTRR